MKKELLPIGSIVTVSGQDLMICAYIKKGSLINNEELQCEVFQYPIG